MMRSQLRRFIFVSAVCFAIAGSASHSFAKKPKGNKNATPAATPAPPPESPTTAPVQPDTSEVSKAQADLLAAETKAKKKFESSPQWTTAEDALSKAQSDSTEASMTVGSAVRAQPEYVEAAANVTKAQDKLQQAKDNGGDGSEISAAATELMTARSALGAIQFKAAEADPNVVAAKQKLATANLAVDQLRKAETTAVQADPDWQAAKKAYDDARSKLASAQR